MLLLAAVASHKFVVGFCLGAELCASAASNLCTHILCVALFSGGSAAGIAIGAALDSVEAFNDSPAVPIMQVTLLMAMAMAIYLCVFLYICIVTVKLFNECKP